MQELEIKDVQSGAVYRIASQGSVIGREGAKADIIIKNPSVSKRHARIYATDGQWFLEDLGSSNGTFFANQRINEPVPLGPGTLFALAEIQFEVVKKPGANGEERGGRDRMRAATAARPDDGELLAGASPRAHSGDDGDDEMAAGVGAIMSALPRAFAHYLIAVPKLAFNPIGTVRSNIAEMPHPAMSWWSLAGWGIPPMVLVALVAVLVSVITMLVAGAFNASVLIGVLTVPIGYVIGALITALIWHPLLTFVIKLLKGHSDARSRSNYFVMTMTSTALTGIVAGVAGLFALIPVPFIGIAPVVLSLGASLISVAVAYFWVKYFEMHKVVQILVLVGLVLTGLGGLFGIYGAIAGGGASIAASGNAAAQVAAAEAAAEAARAAAAAGVAGADAAAAAAAAGMEASEASKMADEKVKAALEASAKAAANGKVTEEAARALAEAAAENAGKDAKMRAEVEKQKAEDARAREEAEKARAAEKNRPEAAEKNPDPPPTRGSGSYAAWASKRDAVEKAITDDPTLLRRGDVLRLYESYTRAAFDVRRGYDKKRSKNEPWRDKIIERQIAADTFDKTKSTIEDLHNKLF